MMESGKKVKNMELELIIIKMVFNLQEGLHWGKNMEMECLFFLMVLEFKDFGRKIIYKDWLKYIIKMEIIIKEIYICHKKQERVLIDGIINKNNK